MDVQASTKKMSEAAKQRGMNEKKQKRETKKKRSDAFSTDENRAQRNVFSKAQHYEPPYVELHLLFNHLPPARSIYSRQSF